MAYSQQGTSMTERKVTIRSAGTAPVEVSPKQTEAEKAAAIRREVYKAAAGGVEVTGLAEGQIELTLKSGIKVIMGPAKIGTLLTISRIVQEEPDNGMLFQIVKALTYIRAIDGIPVNLPQNMVEVKDVLNQLGPGGDEEVFLAYSLYWPPVTTADLQILKKNL
jgi:hypothetical protein